MRAEAPIERPGATEECVSIETALDKLSMLSAGPAR
jgi:hypothetical protein